MSACLEPSTWLGEPGGRRWTDSRCAARYDPCTMTDSETNRLVIFDLDGTLLDTLEDLGDATNRALSRMGFPAHGMSAYNHFLGGGVVPLVTRALPAEARDEETIARGVALMQEEYSDHWAVKTRPYPGIEALLDELVRRGIGLAILSNKPDKYTRVISEHYLSGWPFAIVRGAKSDVPKKPDPTAALAIAAALGVPASRCVFVGDTSIDVETARAAEMTPVGVTWGFRGRDELASAGARLIIDRPDELLGIDHLQAPTNTEPT